MATQTDRKEIRVQSVEQYLKEINKLKEGRDRYFWFRGQENKDWSLLPALLRPDNMFDEEEVVTEYNRLVSHSSEITYKPEVNDLIELQHLGVPTRLLDWTENPLVALWFAAKDYQENIDNKQGKNNDRKLAKGGNTRSLEGCVYVFDPVANNSDYFSSGKLIPLQEFQDQYQRLFSKDHTLRKRWNMVKHPLTKFYVPKEIQPNEAQALRALGEDKKICILEVPYENGPPVFIQASRYYRNSPSKYDMLTNAGWKYVEYDQFELEIVNIDAAADAGKWYKDKELSARADANLLASYFYKGGPNGVLYSWLGFNALVKMQLSYADTSIVVIEKDSNNKLKAYFRVALVETDLKPLALLADRRHARMHAQMGEFVIFPLYNNPQGIEEYADDNMLYKLIIPANKKEAIRKELAVYGIDHYRLFPESANVGKRITEILTERKKLATGQAGTTGA